MEWYGEELQGNFKTSSAASSVFCLQRYIAGSRKILEYIQQKIYQLRNLNAWTKTSVMLSILSSDMCVPEQKTKRSATSSLLSLVSRLVQDHQGFTQDKCKIKTARKKPKPIFSRHMINNGCDKACPISARGGESHRKQCRAVLCSPSRQRGVVPKRTQRPATNDASWLTQKTM